MRVDDSDIVIGGTIDLESTAFRDMSPYFQRLVIQPQVAESLKKALDFHISPITAKNTTFYFDRRQDLEAGRLPEARVSYKWYLPRHPELLEPSRRNKLLDPVPYDDSSLHYKELHFFDDMIRKIKDEKEIWPGIKLQDQGQVGAKKAEAKPEQPTFNPPFASFQRELFVGPSVHEYPVQEL